MPAIAKIRDFFSNEVHAYPVVRESHASFDYRSDAGHIFRIHDAFDVNRVYSDAVAIPIRRKA